LQPHHFSKHSLRTFSKKYNIISGTSFKKKKLHDAVHEQKREEIETDENYQLTEDLNRMYCTVLRIRDGGNR
jgi:hypothetical protein